MAASENGHLDVVKTLIEAGADVYLTYNVGILHCCCTLFLYSNKCTLYCLKLVCIYTIGTISLPIAIGTCTVHAHWSKTCMLFI